jgi:hypothetical protein
LLSIALLGGVFALVLWADKRRPRITVLSPTVTIGPAEITSQ